MDKLIRSSRERCQAKYNLSSGAKSPILRLQADEISHRKERFLDLVGGAVSEVDRSVLLPNRSRYCLLITDADGIVIESYVPEGLEAEFQRSGLVNGSLWDERMAGTNGIAMSIQTGRVVTVLGKEHFYNCFSAFSCSSAPLTDAENKLIGTITLVGSAQRRSDEHALCEQVMRRASRQFQTRLFRNFHADKLTGQLLSRDPALRRSFETLVACDEDGLIVSHLPLWRDGARPPEHQNLTGRHLSELRDLEVNLRGPATAPPRRRIVKADQARISDRIEKGSALANLVAEGGGLQALAERARKLVAHRVPLLVCGEAGVETEGFARALLEDQSLNSPLALSLDATRNGSDTDIADALSGLEFLSDYPVEKVVPTLILRNVESLSSKAQRQLERYLDADHALHGTRAQLPVVIFTASQTWSELEKGDELPNSLLYLLGQSVVELPPAREQDCENVLENVMAEGFGGPFEIADNARDALIAYPWPGNRREMRAVHSARSAGRRDADRCPGSCAAGWRSAHRPTPLRQPAWYRGAWRLS
ncbi:MAG: hypothetical protein KDJ80_08320 [Nitratireductor sp.]|nr:hypothetical protein [Nitratireductor sp.]